MNFKFLRASTTGSANRSWASRDWKHAVFWGFSRFALAELGCFSGLVCIFVTYAVVVSDSFRFQRPWLAWSDGVPRPLLSFVLICSFDAAQSPHSEVCRRTKDNEAVRWTRMLAMLLIAASFWHCPGGAAQAFRFKPSWSPKFQVNPFGEHLADTGTWVISVQSDTRAPCTNESDVCLAKLGLAPYMEVSDMKLLFLSTRLLHQIVLECLICLVSLLGKRLCRLLCTLIAMVLQNTRIARMKSCGSSGSEGHPCQKWRSTSSLITMGPYTYVVWGRL